MRILFINDVYTVGGATKSLSELLLALKAKGHEVIVCTSVFDEFNRFLEENGIANHPVGHLSVMDAVPDYFKKRKLWFLRKQWSYFKAKYKAVKCIEEKIDLKSIDIIHTNSARNDIGCTLYRKYGIPHVMHVREFGIEDFECVVYMPFYYRYLNHTCNVVLSVSNAVRNSWVKKGLKARLVRTLYNGVNFDEFIVNENNELKDGMLRIVMAGGICDTKGQHIAIEALGCLPSEIRRQVYLDFYGWDDPEYLKKIKDRILELNLENQISFKGPVKSVARILYNYNIGLTCSKAEGFGRVTVEYMYAGLGVIASNTGACPEIIDDEKNGLLYSRDNGKDLAEKIIRFYDSPNILSTYGANAHEKAKTQFCTRRYVDDIISVYNEMALDSKK